MIAPERLLERGTVARYAVSTGGFGGFGGAPLMAGVLVTVAKL